LKPRQRAKARLGRPSPGDRTCRPGAASRRIAGRLEVDERSRELVGDRAHTRPVDVTEKVRRPIEAGPNAPLLMRLVRTPFELQPDRPRRTQVFEPAGARPRVPEERLAPMSWAGQDLEALRGPAAGPLKRLERRGPDARPHPFAKARIRAEGEGS